MANFEYTKKHGRGIIDTKPRTYFEENSGESEPFTIEVSNEGVTIYGRMTAKMEKKDDFASFAKAVSEAIVEHARMKHELRTVLSGH